jgi:hypothetical protein
MAGAAERARRARETAASLTSAVQARREGEEVESEFSEEQIARLAELPEKSAAQWIEAMTVSWAWHGYGRDAAFSAEQLAEAADVDVDVAQRFLDVFSVRFGERSDRARWHADPRKALGGEMEAMREHPILHDGEGSYLPCDIETLFYGLRDALTDALHDDAKVWKRFDRHRSRSLEERALRALAGALNADWSHGGVKYWIEVEGARSKRARPTECYGQTAFSS